MAHLFTYILLSFLLLSEQNAFQWNCQMYAQLCDQMSHYLPHHVKSCWRLGPIVQQLPSLLEGYLLGMDDLKGQESLWILMMSWCWLWIKRVNSGRISAESLQTVWGNKCRAYLFTVYCLADLKEAFLSPTSWTRAARRPQPQPCKWVHACS